MGDRGNIVVRQGSSPKEVNDVWLYTHWSGSDIGNIVKSALRRRLRWEDGPYLARIIFDKLTEGNTGDETGFGISATMLDNSHPILVVDVTRQSVYLVNDDVLVDNGLPSDYEPGSTKTFGEFAEIDPLVSEVLKVQRKNKGRLK